MGSTPSELPRAFPEPADSSSVLVAKEEESSPAFVRPTPSQLAFTAPTPPRRIHVGAFALLISVMQLLTGNQELDTRQLASPDYEGAVSYVLAVIDDGSITREFPDVPADRYSELRRAADSQLRMYREAAARSAQTLASPGGASILAAELAGTTTPDKRWAFNGTACARLNDSGGKISVLLWLESLESALRGELGIHDTRIQGQHLRRLLEGPILDQLLRKIEELPDLRAATAAGTATFADYATALIACADPDDTLAVHRAATHPARRAGEKLSDAVARAELAFRSASAHGCHPGEAGRFWAVFGLLTAAERSTFTGRFGVRSRMQRPLRESEEAAAARHAALLSDLLAWAKVQSTTSTPATPRPGPPRAAAAANPTSLGGGGRSTPRRLRRGSAASAAAAAATDDPAAPDSGSEDAAEDPPQAATAAPAAAQASPRSPRTLTVFHYTGDRARDAIETARRRASGECLKCLPTGRIHTCPCPLHPLHHHDSSAPRCFPYRD